MRKYLQKKRETEKKLVSQMITLFCQKNHGTSDNLCPACAELAAYAKKRSDLCPFMAEKTFCANCQTHCYKPDMRKSIREVMRFAGPRMIWRHPLAVVHHIITSQLEKHRMKGRYK